MPDGKPDQPINQAADPTNHLAIALGVLAGDGVILASYTVDPQGNIASNPANDTPNVLVEPSAMQISPSGKLLAIASNFDFPPLQAFNFDGANPITPHSGVLRNAVIDQIFWDNNDHLYALNDSTKMLYVYTFTPTTITEAPGSPYTIASPTGLNALVVVSDLCAAPASGGVHICLPASGSRCARCVHWRRERSQWQ